MDQEPVPARLGQQPVGSEPLAQLGQMLLQRVERRRRRLLDPELLDQASCRDQLVGMQEQQREESALLSPAERDWTFTIKDLEWPEDMELRRNRSTSKRQKVRWKVSPPPSLFFSLACAILRQAARGARRCASRHPETRAATSPSESTCTTDASAPGAAPRRSPRSSLRCRRTADQRKITVRARTSTAMCARPDRRRRPERRSDPARTSRTRAKRFSARLTSTDPGSCRRQRRDQRRPDHELCDALVTFS